MRSDVELRARLGGELRSPSAANMAVHYTGPKDRQIARWDAKTAIQVAYYQNVIAYRCANIIAEDIASLPLRAGKTSEKPQDFNLNSPILKLVGPEGNPNPNTDWHELLVWSICNYLITGRYGWELELTKTRTKEVVAIWPLMPHLLQPVEEQNTSRYFKRFDYTYNAETKSLQPEQVFYHWRPSLDDWTQPESVLQAARYDLSVAIMQDRYDYNFLLNDARPAAVGVTERFATRENFEAFKRQFQGQFGGVENAGKIAWTEADADPSGQTKISDTMFIQTLGLSQKDSEAIARYKQKIMNVTIDFGVPMSRLDASQRTYENADVEDRNYWKGIARPHALRFASAFNRNLAPRFGSDRVWFDFSGVEALKDSQRFQKTRITDLYAEGIIKLDEAREAVDQTPLPDGEGDKFIEVPHVVAPQGAAPADGTQRAAARKYRENRAQADNVERRRKIWYKTDSQVRALEKEWTTSMQKLFAKQRTATVARLEGKRGRQAMERRDPNADNIFDKEFWKKETADYARALYAAVAIVAGSRVSDAFDSNFNVNSKTVQDFITERSNKLAGAITDTTYGKIKDAMTEGIGEGEGIDKISSRIEDVFDDAEGSRADTIARTEVISAYNGAANEAANSLDIAKTKEWIATQDERTRDAHSEADGMMVGIDEEFEVDGETLAYPGDPDGSPDNVINCRCTVAFSDGTTVASMDYAKKHQRRIHLEDAQRLLNKAARAKAA